MINGQNIYAGVGSGDSSNAVVSYNVESFDRHPQEIVRYADGVNTGPTGVAFDSAERLHCGILQRHVGGEHARNMGTVPGLCGKQPC